jgi:hypothetical protein
MRWTTVGRPSKRKNKRVNAAPDTIRKFASGKYPLVNQRSSTGAAMGAPDLESRIAAAFTPDARSSDFPSLIADAEAASKTATTKADAAKVRALDPTTPIAEVTTARRAMEDAVFTSDRMNVAATRLRERYRQVSAAEENARRLIEYDRVTSERDRLAEELAKVYPTMATTLADLVDRIAANNNEINAVNNRLPDSGSRVLEAELIARGMEGFANGGIVAPSIVEQLRLPRWDFNIYQPYAWPIDERLRHASVIPISIRA